MKCAQALGLIDMGSVAEIPREQHEIARRHARSCATCGPALQTSDALTASLAALPRLAPDDLTGAVLARIARIEAPPAVSASASIAATDISPARVPASATLCVAAALAATLIIGSGEPVPMMDAMSIRIARTPGGLVPMPATLVGTIGLTVSLALYAVGLFAPLGSERRGLR
jgi:hypothetical protein